MSYYYDSQGNYEICYNIPMNNDVETYHEKLSGEDRAIIDTLYGIIAAAYPTATNKVWHGHPVWFINDNPIVGYDKMKDSVRVLFWSGQSFDEPGLKDEGSFKAAEIRYTQADQINQADFNRWLEKAEKIQWDYKNIVKNRGQLSRI